MSCTDSVVDSEKILSSLKDCLVPSFPKGNDRPLIKEDFASYTASINQKLQLCKNFVLHSNGCISANVLSNEELVSYLVIVCGQHSICGAWTNSENVELCTELVKKVEVDFKKANGQQFTNSKIVKKILSILRPNLLLKTFKCNPASVICYSWILKKIKSPHLGDQLAEVLPTALILADDFEVENIQLGLESLHHIIQNVAFELLKFNGYNEVILDVLKKCMFQSEAAVVAPQLDCYIALMRTSLIHASLERNDFDSAIKTTLSNMYMEQKVALRTVYASRLASLIEARRLGIVRHLTLVFKILHEYTLEPNTTLSSLEALTAVVRVCWCRGESVKDNVTLTLLKLCVELSQANRTYDVDEVIRLARTTASLLHQAYPKLSDELHAHIYSNETIDRNLGTMVRRIFTVSS